MEFKQKQFWLHLMAVSIPVIATSLVPVLQATGNPIALAIALLFTSLASYHWGSAVAPVAPLAVDPPAPVPPVVPKPAEAAHTPVQPTPVPVLNAPEKVDQPATK